MSALKNRQRQIQMKRLEGISRARQVALCMGLIRHKGKEFVHKYPLYALGITGLGVVILNRTHRFKSSVFGYKQLSLILNLLK